MRCRRTTRLRSSVTNVASVLVTFVLCCSAMFPFIAAAAGTRSPSPSVSESSDTTLTETMSVSNEPPSATATSSSSSTLTPSPVTFTDVDSLTESPSRTNTPSPDASPTVPTRTRTASEADSGTITQSFDVSGYSKTFNVTETESISGTTQVSDSRTSSFSNVITGSEGIETATLSMTMTLSLSMEAGSQTATPSHSPTATPSNEPSRSRSETATVTLYPTEAASISASVSHETRSFTSHKSLSAWSPSVSVTVVQTATATQSHTKRHTHSRTLRISASNSSSFTVVDTQTRSISLSPSRETRTSEMTMSVLTVSPTISASLRRIHAVQRQLSISSTKSFSISLRQSPSPSSAQSSTKTSSEDISASRSGSSTAVSSSMESTKTISFVEELTCTETVSLSGSSSRSQQTVSDWRTQSVTRSPTLGSWQHSMTVTYTVTRSRDLTVSIDTSTATLTESRKAESRTRRITKSTSVSASMGTVTEGLSESRTITWTLSQSKASSTRSQRTAEATATVTPTNEMTVPTVTRSRSQDVGSLTASNTSSPTNDRTAYSASLSQSLSIRTVSGRFTPTPQRGRHSFTTTVSGAITVTTTDSATIGTASQTIHVRRSLSNAFLSAVQSVLFPSLVDSSAPCISLALYIEFPLFLVFLIQLIVFVTAKSLNWRVTTDTHLRVPMWRSLSTAMTYVGVLVPCHLRCAYAHTLRCMLQMLVVLLVLEGIVYGLNPQATNTAAFCVALTIVVVQAAKPLTHLAYHYFRFPHDDELSAQMQLAQMKRIVRLRKNEMIAAKKRERERRRQEGLDDVSDSTDEEPEFAYDTQKVVAFDYLDDEVSSSRRFGELDVEFPSEHDVFGEQEYPELLDEQRTQQVSGPGYVDVTFPGEENLRIIDLFSERRVGGDEEPRALTSSGGGSRKSLHSSSFVRDVPAISAKQQHRRQSRRDSRMTLDNISLGSLASFSSPTRAALAVADGRVTPSSSASAKRKPKKKRIGPGRDGVVVIPDFDDDFGVKELPNSDDEDDAATSAARRRYQKQRDKTAAAGTSSTVVRMFEDVDPSELMDDDDDDEDDQISRASSTGSRFRTELYPIVTHHTSVTIALVLLLGALLFAVDRFDDLCANGFDGSFGALWGIAVLVDATLGDVTFASVVYAYRRLTASGEEGNRVTSSLHPYDGELRTRMYEHISQRFGV